MRYSRATTGRLVVALFAGEGAVTADAISEGAMMKATSISNFGLPAALIVGSTLLTGCVGATYGTGTPADQQLLEDVTGILSLGPADRETITYEPRPELVRPSSVEVLPTPQQPSTASNPAWPESPEQRLARIREDATLNQDTNFRPVVRSSMSGQSRAMQMDRDPSDGVNTAVSASQQREEFNRRLAQNRQGNPTQRRFLSEPPVDYRQPAETAPSDDVGDPEWQKQRTARQAAGERRGWRDFIPGL